ncbi:MAG: CRISPR-associated helicase Cas3 [Gammaproteobacteria bacterium]|nr:MAG: CRISPR-associated helicase Cas3 [Gammaproteobacteria bacterium]TND03217.1 MAG: CRISPR-associated helicase Cas3 [Gammaproteobacteria bacterium]
MDPQPGDESSTCGGAEPFIAHVRLSEADEFVIHDLRDHLQHVARLAAEFGQVFGSADWAHVAGLWHDLGKYSKEFQRRIKSVSGYDPDAHLEGPVGRVDHSTAGAVHAVGQFGVHGRILAYLIAGHHAGLPDWHSGETGGAALNARLGDKSHLERALSQPIPQAILAQTKPASPPVGKSDGFALWVRMLFSCLVDADFLDTETFMDEDKASQRVGYPAVEELLRRFNSHMNENFSGAAPTQVNRIRAEVLRQCREKANDAPGMFSLTVPTGGGKTLSSLAFALEHAVALERAEHHSKLSVKKRRVIYVIPYTSIIEQTANIFRAIFPDAVVEHHSNLDPDKETVKSRLATENWDAPIIVTTNVQFFESLFAARTSRCRKLHNIVNSVVVLDEAQLLPPEFLQPILTVMNLLAQHYGVTFVLSTATQPALNSRSGFGWTFKGLDGVREIVRDPDSLYRDLERVTVELPEDLHQTKSWDEIAERMQAHESVLTVVNSRADARELHHRLPKGSVHLSALMCGEHRSRVIVDIKRRLSTGEVVRVVSTQLVEAGVDVDFPVVYRALAGLDSIAQAAGRCNREGNLERGEVFVFVPPKPAPPGHLRRAAETTVSLLFESHENPLRRELFQSYFEQLYWKAPSLDKQGIEGLLKPDGQGDDQLKVQFRTAAQRFQLIDESGYRSVIVRYGDSPALIGRLKKGGPERWLMRKLQRYTVSLPEYQFKKLLGNGDVREEYPDMYAQTSDALYHPELGVLVGDTNLDPNALVG